MQTNQIEADQEAGVLTANLKLKIGEIELINLALEASQLVVSKPRDNHLHFNAHIEKMLALVTYCYASGDFGSEQVEWACHFDPIVTSICPNPLPDWGAIWRFRNAYQPWIAECLTHVYVAADKASLDSDCKAVSLQDIDQIVRRILRRATWADAAMFDV